MGENKSSQLYQSNKSEGTIKNHALRTCCHAVRIPLFLFVVFYFSLVVVYCIPSSAMKSNAAESYDILSKEGLRYVSYTDGHTYDNYTVATMINAAFNTGNIPFVTAIKNDLVYDSGPIESLCSALEGKGERNSYFRYWHGYLVFLKPMLCFFNLYQIRLLCGTLTIVLLIGTGICLKDKHGKHGIYTSLALALSWGIYSGMNAAITLPISSSFIISLAGSIYVLKFLKLEQNSIIKAFFVIGAVTVYLDFLDNPILTLGIPLCMLIMRMIYGSDSVNSVSIIKAGILSNVFWGFGYLGLWSVKWVLALIVVGPTAYENIMDQIEFRLGVGEKALNYPYTPLSAIFKNLEENGAFRVKIIAGVVALCVVLAIILLIKRRNLSKRRYGNLIQALAVIVVAGMLPFIWYSVLNNHSVIHAEFISWRNLMLTLLALLLLLYILVREIFDNIMQPKLSRADK